VDDPLERVESAELAELLEIAVVIDPVEPEVDDRRRLDGRPVLDREALGRERAVRPADQATRLDDLGVCRNLDLKRPQNAAQLECTGVGRDVPDVEEDS
jgi:hypothetical protein